MFCERPNYLKDAMFKGQYDANPMYVKQRVKQEAMVR